MNNEESFINRNHLIEIDVNAMEECKAIVSIGRKIARHFITMEVENMQIPPSHKITLL